MARHRHNSDPVPKKLAKKLAKKFAKTGKTITNMKLKNISKCAKVARATNFVDAATS
jgi:hypothetical protein